MPAPYRYSRKIPGDLTFALRPGPVARVLLLIACLAPAAFEVVMMLTTVGIDPRYLRLDLSLGAMAVAAALLGLLCWRVLSRARLAADGHGVWVCVRWWPVKAIWLPWYDVAHIGEATNGGLLSGSRGAVRVVPRDENAGRGLGALADAEQAWNRIRFGGRLVARMPPGRRMSSVLTALARLAGTGAPTGAPGAAPVPPGTAPSGSPYRLAPTAPTGLPLTLTANRTPQLRVMGLAAGVVIPVLVIVGFLITRGQPLVGQLTAIGVMAVVIIVVFGVLLGSAAYRGPVFSADPYGAWVCYRRITPGRHDAVFLPWEAIGALQVLSGNNVVALRIQPRGPWIANQSTIPTPEDRMLDAVFRTGMTVTVDPGYQSPTDLAGILSALSAGRCPVTLAAPTRSGGVGPVVPG